MGLWDIEKIPYVGREKGPQEGLAFHYYDADKVVAGKKMKDWLRFGVAWWHTFDQELVDPFGTGTAQRPWYGKYSNAEDEALAKVDYAFEFFQKLGVKLLWNTSSLFTNPRFVSGASTSPFADIYAYAGGQLKHSLEIAKRLGAENYVFWGGREGYENLWNTQMKREQAHMAKFFHMCHEYAQEIGLDAQFLIEPKAKEPTMHQYDFDASTAIAFLKTYDIDFMKLNLEGNHANLAGHTYQHEIRTHIAGMDAFAAGLLVAAKMHEDKVIENLQAERYSSFDSGIGATVENGTASLASLEEYALDIPQSKLIEATKSDHLESVKATINNYMIDALAEA